jgi:hypothetical protein
MRCISFFFFHLEYSTSELQQYIDSIAPTVQHSRFKHEIFFIYTWNRVIFMHYHTQTCILQGIRSFYLYTYMLLPIHFVTGCWLIVIASVGHAPPTHVSDRRLKQYARCTYISIYVVQSEFFLRNNNFLVK